jgi:hypothetical protein
MQSRFMSAFGTVAAIVIVVVTIAAVAWGVYKEPGVVGSLATAAGAVIAVVYQRERENRREVAQRHREQLAPLYEDLFVRFNTGLDASKPDDQEFLAEVQRKLLFYGSVPVLREWLRLMRFIAAQDPAQDDGSNPVLLLMWEQVLFAIRNDLGDNSEGLRAGDLLRVHVHDSDEHVQPWLAENPEHEFRRQ